MGMGAEAGAVAGTGVSLIHQAIFRVLPQIKKRTKLAPS